MDKIIFATGNEHKMEEVRMILKDLGAEILSQKDTGITSDAVEDGTTFEENALIKAVATAKAAREVPEYRDVVVLADDSGLEIDYLDGEPGVHSARYMGENTPYQEKNNQILKRLEGVPMEQRTARFVCVIAAVFPDGRCVTVRETMEGYIGWEARGEQGFGYDPIFYVEPAGLSNGELSMEEKNRLSHRGKALRLMKEELKKL